MSVYFSSSATSASRRTIRLRWCSGIISRRKATQGHKRLTEEEAGFSARSRVKHQHLRPIICFPLAPHLRTQHLGVDTEQPLDAIQIRLRLPLSRLTMLICAGMNIPRIPRHSRQCIYLVFETQQVKQHSQPRRNLAARKMRKISLPILKGCTRLQGVWRASPLCNQER